MLAAMLTMTTVAEFGWVDGLEVSMAFAVFAVATVAALASPGAAADRRT